MVRVVLDSNIIVSASLTLEGAPATIVELALLGTFTLCLSRPVFDEYREVLSRPKFSRHADRIKVLLEGIEETAEWSKPEETLDLSPDEADNRLLECAQAADAKFLVTGNSKHFPDRLGEVVVLTPRQFLIEFGF